MYHVMACLTVPKLSYLGDSLTYLLSFNYAPVVVHFIELVLGKQ